MARRRLVCDVGGTNVRFALVGEAGGLERIEAAKLASHATFEAALDAYLAATGAEVAAIAIAAAGPVRDGRVRLTNAAWTIDEAALSARLGGAAVRVLNDLEAVALALPGLGPEDVATIHPGAPAPRLPRIAVNVGTGFGAAVAAPVADGGWTALATEPGHMSFTPPPFARGAATVEGVFSGPAYARLFPGGIGAAARTPYSAAFGRVVGDLVLATGAWGGVFLCGGVMDDFERIMDRAAFLAAFPGDTPMTERLSATPICRILAESPALRGLVAALPAV